MSKFVLKELDSLKNLIDHTSIKNLEIFFINSNLTLEQRENLVGIITNAILPIVLKDNEKSDV